MSLCLKINTVMGTTGVCIPVCIHAQVEVRGKNSQVDRGSLLACGSWGTGV